MYVQIADEWGETSLVDKQRAKQQARQASARASLRLLRLLCLLRLLRLLLAPREGPHRAADAEPACSRSLTG